VFAIPFASRTAAFPWTGRWATSELLVLFAAVETGRLAPIEILRLVTTAYPGFVARECEELVLVNALEFNLKIGAVVSFDSNLCGSFGDFWDIPLGN
jgi:hypothetical protein